MTPPSIYYSLNLVNLLQYNTDGIFNGCFFEFPSLIFLVNCPLKWAHVFVKKGVGLGLEFFRVLFCDLEGLLQQFVAASETRGKLCIGTQVR